MPHFSLSRAELGSPSPWELPEETLDHQGLPEGLLLPKVEWDGVGVGWRPCLPVLLLGWPTCPPHAQAPSHLGCPFPAGHAVSVYKDLGMMSLFLPDLQLFSLMLCCLGGTPPPRGGPSLCPSALLQCPPPQASIVPCCKYPWGCGGMGVQARETVGGWGWG